MGDKVVAAVNFGCSKCHSSDLREPACVRTATGIVYMAFICGECGDQVHLKLDSIVAEIYKDVKIKGNNGS